MSAFASSTAKFPPQVHHTCIVNEIHTDIVSTEYADRIFVHITQLGKFGTVMKAWAEPRSERGSIYHVSTVMGKRDDPLLQIYARQIIERLSATTSKPLLLALSLKSESRDAGTFQTILNELFQNNAWNL